MALVPPNENIQGAPSVDIRSGSDFPESTHRLAGFSLHCCSRYPRQVSPARSAADRSPPLACRFAPGPGWPARLARPQKCTEESSQTTQLCWRLTAICRPAHPCWLSRNCCACWDVSGRAVCNETAFSREGKTDFLCSLGSRQGQACSVYNKINRHRIGREMVYFCYYFRCHLLVRMIRGASHKLHLSFFFYL